MYTNLVITLGQKTASLSLVEVGGIVGIWQSRIDLKKAARLMCISAVHNTKNADTTAVKIDSSFCVCLTDFYFDKSP